MPAAAAVGRGVLPRAVAHGVARRAGRAPAPSSGRTQRRLRRHAGAPDASGGAPPQRPTGKSAGRTGRPGSAGPRADGPQPGPARSSAPRSATPRTGAPRSGAARSGPPRTGAPRRTSASRDVGREGGPRAERPTRDERPPLPRKAAGWGNVARRGAHQVSKRDAEERSLGRLRRAGTPPRGAAARSRQAQWKRDDGAPEWEDLDAPTRKGKAPGARTRRRQRHARPSPPSTQRHALPPEIAADIRNAADIATVRHREHLVERAESAYGAYERGPLPGCDAGHQARGRRGPGRGRRA